MTLLEGPAALVRGMTRYALAEGVRLQPGDIIEVSDKGLTEIEFADGAALALSPGTRMLAVSAPRGKSAAGDYYMTQGALKLSGVKQGASFRFVTPVFTLQPAEGTTVLVLAAAKARCSSRAARRASSSRRRKARRPRPCASRAASSTRARPTRRAWWRRARPRPSSAALPKVFLDPLPSRMARYKEREVQPKRVDDVSYAEVETWLKAPPDIRRPMLARFRPRVSDPAFRAALVANLKSHPEWDPILFPEKYKPKEPAARRAPPATRRTASRPRSNGNFSQGASS